MPLSAGVAYIDIVPNMEGFAASVDEGVSAALAPATEEAAAAGEESGAAFGEGFTGTAVTGTEEGTAAAAEASAGEGGLFAHAGALIGAFIGYEIVKKSAEAFDTVEKNWETLGAALQAAHIEKELPDLQSWATSFSFHTGIAIEEIQTLARQLVVAGVTGTSNIENMTNAIEGLAQETGKSVSMWTRSVIPSIINSPASAVSTLQKWNILTLQQVNHIKALVAAGHSHEATLIEQNALIKKGMNEFKSTPMERFSNDLHLLMVWFGSHVVPILDTIIGGFLKVAQWVGHVWSKLQEGKGVIANVERWFRHLSNVGKVILIGLAAGVAAFLLIFSPATVVFLGIAGAIVLIVKNWDKIKPAIERFWAAAKPILDELWKFLDHKINRALKDLHKAWREISRFIEANVLPIFDALLKWFQSIWPIIKEVAAGIGTQLIKVWNALVDVFKTDLLPALGDLYDAVKTLWNAGLKYVVIAIGIFIIATLKLALFALPILLKTLGFVIRVLAKVIDIVAHVVSWFLHGFGKIVAFVGNAVGSIIRFFKSLPSTIAHAVEDVYHAVTSWFGKAATWVITQWNKVVTFFGHLPGILARAGKGMWNWLVSGAKTAINAVIGVLNEGIGFINQFQIHIHVNPPGPGEINFDWNGPGIPTIPTLAQGGIVTRPTLALVGEAGPEAIIPLNRAGSSLAGTTIKIVDSNLGVVMTGVVVDQMDRQQAFNSRAQRMNR